jgi:acetoin utilization deacetylase AcuC-like enzyme
LRVVTISHPSQYRHAVDGHPERPQRVDAFLAGAEAAGVGIRRVDAPEPPPGALLRVHPEPYLETVLAARDEAAMLDADTYVTPGSAEAALRSAGGAIAAVELTLAGDVGIAVGRPPGHHALPARSMGFCLLANVAIAVRHAQAVHGVTRVAVIDWDVHHGNGTQEIFWDDPSVLAVSLHEWPRWPYSGAADETGGVTARGATLNVPITTGTGPQRYLDRFRSDVLPVVEQFAPTLVVIACGFDAHRRDPLAGLELESETYGELVIAVRGVCRRLGIVEPAVCLEGGYDLEAVRGGANALVEAYAATQRG